MFYEGLLLYQSHRTSLNLPRIFYTFQNINQAIKSTEYATRVLVVAGEQNCGSKSVNFVLLGLIIIVT